MKSIVTLLSFFVTLLFIFSISSAQSQYSCLDSNTLNKTIDITVGGTRTLISELTNCTYGCLNGVCSGSFSDADINSMWLVYAIGIILLVLGTVLGMPYGKFSGQENIKMESGFDTTIVIKYIFFFVGLYFVYLSLGMSRRMSTTYGSESTITGALDTTTMVMTITLGLFIFIFVLEFVFMIMKTMKEQAEDKKWGERGEE